MLEVKYYEDEIIEERDDNYRIYESRQIDCINYDPTEIDIPVDFDYFNINGVKIA